MAKTKTRQKKTKTDKDEWQRQKEEKKKEKGKRRKEKEQGSWWWFVLCLRRQKIYKDANVCDGRGGLLDRHEMESGESKNKKMILGGVEI